MTKINKLLAACLLVITLVTTALAPVATMWQVDKLASMPVRMQHQYLCINRDTQEIDLAGSSFALDANRIMTAKHLLCPTETQAMVSTNEGFFTELQVQKISPDADAMILISTHGYQFKPPFAVFANPQIGEHVTAYGSAMYGLIETGFLMDGKVQGLSDYLLLSSCNIAPGMSGSALLDDSGHVVGMNTQAIPTWPLYGGVIPWGLVTGSIPAGVLVVFEAP